MDGLSATVRVFQASAPHYTMPLVWEEAMTAKPDRPAEPDSWLGAILQRNDGHTTAASKSDAAEQTWLL